MHTTKILRHDTFTNQAGKVIDVITYFHEHSELDSESRTETFVYESNTFSEHRIVSDILCGKDRHDEAVAAWR